MRKGMTSLITLLVIAYSSAAVSSPISVIEKNQLPALLSFDYAAELLGLYYGADNARPNLTATGSISDTGFSWTSTNTTYLGSLVSWSANGSYDALTDSLHWSGTGSYAGNNWSLSGDLKWLSDSSFEIAHDYSILGLPGQNGVFTGTETGQPGWDVGNVTSSSEINYEITRSRTWFQKLFGISGKVDNVKVTVTNGIITSDELKIYDESSGAGISIVNKGGHVSIGGGGFEKKITIQAIPEPSTISLLVPTLVGLLLLRSKRGRHSVV